MDFNKAHWLNCAKTLCEVELSGTNLTVGGTVQDSDVINHFMCTTIQSLAEHLSDFFRGIEKPSGLYILRNSSSQSKISHLCRNLLPRHAVPELEAAVACRVACSSRQGWQPWSWRCRCFPALSGNDGRFQIGCRNYAIYITPRVSLCPLKKTDRCSASDCNTYMSGYTHRLRNAISAFLE